MAGFNTAVTGLKSASTMLDVTGNNIANASTVGFKSSRTEFADIYAASVVGAGSSNIAGSGVTVSDISQDFSAGTIEFTNNNLDLAINGQGFFQLDDGRGGVTYTRAGAFELDKEGAIVSKTGSYLQGYALNASGDRTTIQNMAVTDTTNPPKPTELVELALNIDASLDPTKLLATFDKSEPSSYSYSTTVEAVSNLGDSTSIRYYFVEQKPSRDVYSYDVSADPTGNVTISGVTLNYDAAAPQGNITQANLDALAVADPRIDITTVNWDTATETLNFELFAEYSSDGDFIVDVPIVIGYPQTRAANEVQSFNLDNNVDYINNPPAWPLDISFGGVNMKIFEPQSLPVVPTNDDYIDAVGTAIAAYDSQVLEANPDIESFEFQYDANNNPQIVITWKAALGDVEDDRLSFIDDATDQIFANTDAVEVAKGDASYLGAYRLYAYLEDTVPLDIGKETDPGLDAGTEPGAVIVKFDAATGLLSKINEVDVSDVGNVPKLTISDWDELEPDNQITLDLTGTTQFSSASIIKKATQDGYPAGDLIGVSFGPSGEVVASFSNGQQQNLGIVQIATFANQAGLQSAGDTEWIATLLSGSAVLNDPGTGLGGTLSQAALEQSNVDLSAELVNLIKGQRNFQANSKTLETMNTVTQAILQI